MHSFCALGPLLELGKSSKYQIVYLLFFHPLALLLLMSTNSYNIVVAFVASGPLWYMLCPGMAWSCWNATTTTTTNETQHHFLSFKKTNIKLSKKDIRHLIDSIFNKRNANIRFENRGEREKCNSAKSALSCNIQ